VPGDLAQLFPGSGQVYKPAIVVPGSNSAVRISRLHGPHFKSDTLKIVDDPRNRKGREKGWQYTSCSLVINLGYLAFHLAAVF